MRGHFFDISKRMRVGGVFRADEQEAERVTLDWQGHDDRVTALCDGPPRPVIMPLHFAFLLAAFFVFKAAIIASIGQGAYATALHGLKSGTVIERVGAFIMMPDMASQAIAHRMAALPR